MNLIEKLGLEKCKAIANGAPVGATDYSNEDSEIVYYQKTNNVIFWDSEYRVWDEVYFMMPELKSLSSLRTAIANHGTPTNKGISIIDQFINSGGFDAAIQQQLQSELNNCSASNSSKNSIEDNCTDIRNHISPNTIVLDNDVINFDLYTPMRSK